MEWLEGYAHAIKTQGGRLILSDVGPQTLEVLRSKRLLPEVLMAYPEESIRFAATAKAYADARGPDAASPTETDIERMS